MKKALFKPICLIMSVIMLISFFPAMQVYASDEIIIAEQPTDITAEIGETVYPTVTAYGDNLKYEWQTSTKWNPEWTISSNKGRSTRRLEVSVKDFTYNTYYRCCITDSNGKIAYSDVVHILKDSRLAITKEPNDIEASVNDIIHLTVEAEGSGLSYEWQTCQKNSTEWTKSKNKGCQKDTLEINVQSYSYSTSYRCVITDSLGNSLTTRTVKIIEKTPYYLQIINQPQSMYVDLDQNCSFSVEAMGNNISYQWQTSTDNGATWVNSTFTGNKKNTISFISKSYLYKNLYRVVINDAYENTVISDTVRIYPSSDEIFDLSNKDYDNKYGDGYTRLIDCDTFISKAKKTDKSVTLAVNKAITSSHLYILKFTAIANEKNAKLNIKVNNSTVNATYPIYTEKAEYYIPFSGTSSIGNVSLNLVTDKQKISISDFQIVDFENTDALKAKAGIYLVDAKNTLLAENQSIGAKTNASTADENYVYSIGYGVLSIYTADEECRLISTLNGLSDCYDIGILENGALVISSRQAGIFFVDISDIYHPVIASNYKSLELATGLCANGNYAFVCSRYSGTEIIDANDIYNPIMYSKISNNEEFYDCSVYDNHLYISLWGQRAVKVYDITDARYPKFITNIETDGNAGGIVVQNGILYVATGYHSRDTSTNATKCGFGMGNGFEIYDVRNPSKPAWLSTSKIDGRYRYSGYDFWKLKVSDNIVTVANTYCGLYVYDVSNLTAPKRVDHISVRINKSSANYKSYNSGTYIFNFDTNDYHQPAILSVCMTNDYIYFGDTVTGLYRVRQDGANAELYYNDTFKGSSKPVVEINDVEGYEKNVVDLNTNILCAKRSNDLIYVGASNGIYVLDNELNTLSYTKTDFFVSDLILTSDGKYMYTAEGYAGVGVYEVNNEQLVKKAVCKNSTAYNYCATSLIFSDESELKIIVQAGFQRVSVINVNSKNRAVLTMPTTTMLSGTMYYRNICQGTIDNQNVVLFDSANITLYDKNASTVRKITNSIKSESNGMTVVNNKVLAIYSGGYIYFDPFEEARSLSTLPITKIDNLEISGKATAYDNILVVTGCNTGEFYIIDVTDIENPRLISHQSTNGNLDLAYMDDAVILIPLRNDGLLLLTKETA